MMALQYLPRSDATAPASEETYHDRRRRVIGALHELKSRISQVEQQHSYLRNDLSSACDKAILSLQDTSSAGTTIDTPAPSTRINPLSLAIDKAGACIINGLDRMGDGVISLFLKISRVFS